MTDFLQVAQARTALELLLNKSLRAHFSFILCLMLLPLGFGPTISSLWRCPSLLSMQVSGQVISPQVLSLSLILARQSLQPESYSLRL